MKLLYSLYAVAVALIIAVGVVLLAPPRTVYACTGSASCQNGESVRIPTGATSCSCVDNVGCTWTIGGRTYSQKCAVRVSD